MSKCLFRLYPVSPQWSEFICFACVCLWDVQIQIIQSRWSAWLNTCWCKKSCVLRGPLWSSGELDSVLRDVLLGVISLSCWLMCFPFSGKPTARPLVSLKWCDPDQREKGATYGPQPVICKHRQPRRHTLSHTPAHTLMICWCPLCLCRHPVCQ